MYEQGSRDWRHIKLTKDRKSGAGGNNKKGSGTNLTANYITMCKWQSTPSDRNFSKSQSLGGSLEFFEVPGPIWGGGDS